MSENSSRAQSQLDLIFEVAPMGLLLVNQDQEIITYNPALARCLGYEADELIDTCLIDHCHPNDRDIIKAALERKSQQPSYTPSAVVRLRKQSGSYLWVELAVGKNPSGKGLPGDQVIVVQDIQERKKMELEVLELRHRLNVQVEQERNQLAQELHDGPMQDLHSIQYQLTALEKEVPEWVNQLLQGVLNTIAEVNQELRNISYNLRPPALSRFGLAKTIRSHAEEFSVNHPEFTIRLDLFEDGNRLNEDLRLALYRIYQQALGNILQHSEASEIRISLQSLGSDLEMLIQDDGKGFNLPERWISLAREGHYGLAGSYDRVTALGGEFIVDSTPGKGTTLRIHIPDALEEEN